MIDSVTAFLGRFHPSLVHFPIGILFISFLFECLTANERYKAFKPAVSPSLLLGTVFAIASAITGYFLRKEGGYDENIATLHQNAGIATAVFSLVVYVVRRRLKFWVINPKKRKQARILIFTLLILLLSLTGHLGGSLTHGEDYLFSAAVLTGTETPDPALKIKKIENIPDAIVYRDVIQPIFEARCYDCHSSRKQKGELRLDKEDFIVRGGKHGAVTGDGIADSSTIFKRLVLPLEDKHHMPPNEKPQLSSSEIDLIKYWLAEKPLFTRKVSQFQTGEKITAIIESLKAPARQSWIPSTPVDAAKENAIEKINGLGLHPMPLAVNSNYLMVSFTNARKVTNEQINSLTDIRDQLVWLDLSHTTISDDQLALVQKLNNLRVLYLNDTQVSDTGVSAVSNLTDLRFLNLVGTRVTDRSIPSLSKLEKLTTLFLYKTGITSAGIQRIREQRQQLEVDTGNYLLEKLPSDTIIFKKISK
jgi:uncharacterized membrane protein